MLEAHKKSIATLNQIENIEKFEVDFVFEVTGNASIYSKLQSLLQGKNTKIIEHESAYFLFEVLGNLRDEEESYQELYLVFRVFNEDFAFPVSDVAEIGSYSEVTALPDTPNYLKGVLNIRGKIIPLVDLRVRFNSKDVEDNSKTSVIIVETHRRSIGFMVDSVKEVLEIAQEKIKSPPPILGDLALKRTYGITERENRDLIFLLDVKAMVDDILDDEIFAKLNIA